MSTLLLAPMEGLADSLLRGLLTRAGGFDGAVSEFVRVSGSLLPLRTFRRICPELDNGSRTSAGTPVVVQLLGSHPELMAENAARLAGLSPAGIDLNFGCPAPTVNRHGGGAMLLDDPEIVGRIATAVRQAVPKIVPVSAKMRLGVRDTSKTLACAAALDAAGVSSLVVHARTKTEGYRPPAHWEWIARVRETVSVPVVANGEVWSLADYVRCRAVTGCEDVMIGRGAVCDPFLASRIRAWRDGCEPVERPDADWIAFLPLLADFWQQVQEKVEARHAPGRLKLWLNSLQRTYPEAKRLHQAIRRLSSIDEVGKTLAGHGVPLVQPTRISAP